MTGCCGHAASAGRLFSFFARHYRRRFARRGFEPSQRHLLEGLGETGYAEDMPPWLSRWLFIVVDNTMHIVINGLAIRYLG